MAKPTARTKLTSRWRLAEVIATLVFVSAPAGAQPAPIEPMGPEAPASPRDLEKLRAEVQAAQAAQAAQLARQADELARLQRALEEERTARQAERTEAQQKLDETRHAIDDAALVRARRFGLSLTGYVQADAVAWRQSSQDEINPSTGDLLNQTRFLIRRARLRTELDTQWIAGALEFDGNTVNGPQARIIGAEASFIWRSPGAVPYLQATLGMFKTPFGFEVIQSDRDRLFLERSTAEHGLFPGEYDLGARLQGGWRFLRYAVGAMNGDPVGEKQWPGRDPNESKDFVGRLGVDLAFRRVGVRAGVSGLVGTGFHKGIAPSKDTLVWRDTNEDGAVQLNEITVIPGQPGQPSKNFDRNAFGGDVELTFDIPRLGELMVYGELYSATNLDRGLILADPVATGRDLRELGFYVAATMELTRYGMIGIRYDFYNPDRDSNDTRDGVQVLKDASFTTLALAACLQWPPYGRLTIEYDHNTNPNGRTKTGLPTTLPDDALTIRGQVSF